MLEIRELEGALEVSLHVRPRARKAGVGGCHAGALQVRVCEAPEDGRANEAVRAALADALRIRRADVELLAGLRGRRKRVRLRGDPAFLRARIEALAAI
jgi:hypothetical protein